MYQLLIDSHKRNIVYLVSRLPRDVGLYSEMLPVETGLQKAVDNLTAPNLLIWVKHSDGNVLAQSETLKIAGAESIPAQLMTRSQMPSQPQVTAINGRYLVLYSGPLKVKGRLLGQLYVAQDITSDQAMLIIMVRGLSIVSVLVILIITLVIALYVQRSLQPLRKISQMTQAISAKDLGQTRLQLAQAPSEVKELAQTFNMMLSRLSEAWEQQRQFVGNASHELRTPLTIVHGYLQSTLKRGVNLTEPQREALEIAISEADRTIHLLQDLLDLARADSGYMHFREERFVLNDLVAEVVGMAEQFSDHPIFIEAGAPVEIRADSDRLRQVLINLLDNAMKYSDSGTPISLRIEQTAETVILQVRDRGYGIPLQQQVRIFERFYRLDEARTRSTGGSGLGLAIVKTLVEGMGGSVTVRSRLGEGSMFTVTLPTQPPQ
jgi:heavy metal sensor kinase